MQLSFQKFLNLLFQENFPFNNIRFLANEINLANILTSKINRFITVQNYLILHSFLITFYLKNTKF